MSHRHHHPPSPPPAPDPVEVSELWIQRQILWTLRDINLVLQEILFYVKPILTHSIAVHFQGDSTMPSTNSLVLNVGQTSTASITPLDANGSNPSPNGVVSGVAFNFNDPSATVVLNADNLTATVTAIAASTGGAVLGTATCTVTDTDTAVSQWTQQFTILVNGVVPPAQTTQSIAVSFTDPA